MADESSIPQTITKRFSKCILCGQGTPSKERYCFSCRAKLTGAGAAVEVEVTQALRLDTGLLTSDDVKIPRLGERLVEQNLLDPEMLEFALRVQSRREQSGSPILLGQLLTDMGLVDKQALEQVAMQQLLQTQDALKRSNQELERRVQNSTHQLKDALVKLKELNRMKADFMANLSVELRAPLAAMIGFVEKLIDQSLGPLNPRQLSAMQSLIAEGRRLEELVDDLRTFSDMAQGEIRLQVEPAKQRQEENSR